MPVPTFFLISVNFQEVSGMGFIDKGKNLGALIGIGSILGGLGLTLYGTGRSFQALSSMSYSENSLSNFCIDVGQKMGYSISIASTIASIGCGITGALLLYGKLVKEEKQNETPQ